MSQQTSAQEHAPRARRPQRPPIPAFRRSAQNRVVAGVAGGLARAWDVDVVLVRAAFVALAVAGGAGVLLYLLAWTMSAEPATVDAPPRRLSSDAARQRRLLGLACVVLGVLVICRDVGLWFGDRLVWPLVLGILGSAVIWVRGDMRGAFGGGRTAVVRIAVGALLVAGGMAAIVVGNPLGNATVQAVLAMAVTAGGLLLILGPWLFRVWREAAEDRRRRIRSEERAEMAAHLHDSVLNTLALIQRSRDASPDVVAMARTQERELRAWLQGRTLPSEEAQTLGEAIEGVAARVERDHAVAVESVVVGDCALDERVRALVAAVQEAAVNAARHSGEAKVSIYVEVDGARITAYVRDRGRGFEPAQVQADRRGIRESIEGRLQRHGGSAAVSSAPGDGTQVELQVERDST
jgi:phage shock protein PspC (stress-responsive transcriptional regulator)/two-component sensor histidine kinase